MSQNGAPTTVLLHGWGSHSDIWEPVMPAIGRQLSATCVDLPGHGSFRDFAADWTLENVSRELLTRLPDGPFWCIGWSLGAQLALALARQVPARIKGLVLVSATPRFVAAADWPHGMASPVLQGFYEDLASEPQRTLERFASLQLGKQVQRERLRLIRELMFRHPLPDQASLAGGLAVLRDTDWRPVLNEINQPALVLYGDRDRLVPPAASESLAAALPRGRARCIEGAAHMPFLTHESQWSQAVLEFIGEFES